MFPIGHNNSISWALSSIFSLGRRQDNPSEISFSDWDEAIQADDVDWVNAAIRAGCDIHLTDEQNRTPLYHARAMGKAEIVRVLLEAGAFANQLNDNGWWWLGDGSKKEHAVLVRKFLKGGVKVKANERSVPEFLAKNPQAIPTLEELLGSNADESVFDLLLGGNVRGVTLPPELVIDTRVVDESDYTPLHWAAWKGNVQFAKALIAAGADINAETGAGMTALNFATFGAKGAGVKKLLEGAGAALGTHKDPGVTCEEGPPNWEDFPLELLQGRVLQYLDPLSENAFALAAKWTNAQVEEVRRIRQIKKEKSEEGLSLFQIFSVLKSDESL